ncbi:hypothetical protein KUCAC02_021814, partial [Chaenocephalus aceratus]
GTDWSGSTFTSKLVKFFRDYKLAIQESESSEVAIEVHEGHAELRSFRTSLSTTFHLQSYLLPSSKAPSSYPPSLHPTSTLSLRTLSSLSVVPPPSSTSTLSSLSVVHPPSPSTSTLSSLSVVPPSSPSTSTLSSLSVVPPPSPSTSTLSSLSVVPPPSPSTSTLSSLSVVPPPSPSTSTPVLTVCGPSSISIHQHPVLTVCGPSSISITSTLSSLSVVPPPSPSTSNPVLTVCGPSSISIHQHPVLTVCGPSSILHQHPVLHNNSTSVDDCVGPDNIEGYGAVQELAEFFVWSPRTPTGLKWRRVHQNNHSVALGDFDKRKTIYPPRHKNTLKQGRFRATKKIVAPGVESTKRCFIGAHSPAQWPDCNRVVEAIFTRLCDLYKNSVHCEGKRVSRFTMVIRVYKHIRECVITNAKVMTETTIQLPEVNVATVTQWFSRRCRSQEQQILKQGIPAPDAPIAGPEKLLLAKQKGTSLFPGSLAEPHAFVLPPNTAANVGF